jgi:ABC-2 type transport system ATP-binding protein
MTTALSVTHLRKTYNSGLEALKDVSFEVADGDFFALLGPNGAGKSTTIGIISTLVKKTQGQVTVFGHDLDSDPMALKRCIGVVPQEFNFSIFDKVIDIIVNQAGYYGVPYKRAKENATYFLKQLDLWDKRNTPAGKLSGGMKRRLMIARGMVHEPRLLLLDEPTAGVDVEMRRLTWDFLRAMNRQGVTIILTTHYLEEAEALCKHTAIIDKGLIRVKGDIQELLKHQSRQTYIIECNAESFRLPTVPGYDIVWQPEAGIIEVNCPGNAPLNPVLAAVAEQNVKILGVRPSASRLEQFFLDLVKSRESS